MQTKTFILDAINCNESFDSTNKYTYIYTVCKQILMSENWMANSAEALQYFSIFFLLWSWH